MGKHSGQQDPNDVQGPYGPGPHPTPEESQKKADDFDRQYGNGGDRRKK
jgi:hypothetical protein